ncbi:hypothetical protein HPB48_003086 [Haemaphysalis longicornis]|uniref:Uncharacterized protein n=1 Tax=Haemaphysalis longicornis TaxID=44386 RepID=A0A9J6G1D5_HAELO|nr:hypothetical protein HPB48_003086 [Haemaphysalis longicornis]
MGAASRIPLRIADKPQRAVRKRSCAADDPSSRGSEWTAQCQGTLPLISFSPVADGSRASKHGAIRGIRPLPFPSDSCARLCRDVADARAAARALARLPCPGRQRAFFGCFISALCESAAVPVRAPRYGEVRDAEFVSRWNFFPPCAPLRSVSRGASGRRSRPNEFESGK